MLFEVRIFLSEYCFEQIRAKAAECSLSAQIIGEAVSTFGAVESLERLSAQFEFRWSFPGSPIIHSSSDLGYRLRSRMRVCFRPVMDGIPDQLWDYAFGGVA